MLFEYLKVSWLMMRSKPVRALLSLLGIYIGVLALVIILAIREGIRRQIEGLYHTSGAHVVFVHPGFDQVSKKIGRLTLEEVTRLKEVPEIVSVLPRSAREADMRTGGMTLRGHLAGIDENFVPLYRVPVVRGRIFLPEEMIKKRAVCLVTTEAARKLFPSGESIGQLLDVEGVQFEVIGILDWTQEVSQRTSITDADVLVPALWLAPQEGDFISTLEVRVGPEIEMSRALELVRRTLSHGDTQREKLYFIRSLDQMVQRSRDFNDRILGGLLGIAAISLLVGGIGVANVMVTSVTERTREVGIRKALGASRHQILLQFLVESTVLTCCGGLLAVLTGLAGIDIAPVLFALATPLAVPYAPVLACLAITLFVGLAAGVYPASQAAHLSPAEALRHE